MTARLKTSSLRLIYASSVLVLAAVTGCAQPGAAANSSASDKGVWFVEPADGAVVPQTFKVKFGLKGMAVDPAGEQKPGKGHHHLLINRAGLPPGQIIPADDTHIHFGKGQTETEVKLAPGNYRLTMQFADGYHLSYGPEMAASINVTVK